jgi:hypothetical protein
LRGIAKTVRPACSLSREKNPTGRSLFFTQDLRQNISEPQLAGAVGQFTTHRKSLRTMAFRYSVTVRLTFVALRRTKNTHKKYVTPHNRADMDRLPG